ncbi:hypothetical protein Pan161_59710 [Gimesia algae]|uniref:Uncharacterized protein n=2 Tax=Gimesia algae TaxID=2527971 RepID=A0A517VMQ8_9PLAN|nr:hypothetical protein Pan161_59710 [Gimesia algae]
MSAEDDEMINVGDNNSTNHYYPPAQDQQQQTPSTMASLAKAAIVAAGMASGLGGAGWFIAEALDKQPVSVPVPEFKDTNTQYEIILK